MAKVSAVVHGQQLIGDVQTDDVENSAITDAKISAVSGSKLTAGTVTVDALSAALKAQLFPYAVIGRARIGYCKIGP